MNDILERMLAHKRAEVAARKQRVPLKELRARCAGAPPVRGFAAALRTRVASGQAAVIAEIKRASPSRGLIRADFQPAALARGYAAGGATCLSVLTDTEFFQGSDVHLAQARGACALPVLRKDFTLDKYQVYEARALGADAVLLIAAALDNADFANLHALAIELGLDVLVEVHNAFDLRRALPLPNFARTLLGINNRNLRTFVTDIQTTLLLRADVPAERLLVSESGITSRGDVARLRAAGVDAFLIGEAFMRADDPGAALAGLFAGG
ncbi:MAG: indole-3-glycerol phosphate synthase TrpC [Rhodanobacteraceae bacterium]|nr:MAG: indole-3-glycerol phosphate synthase TrpC [Rhodanobacteraceae bacterium]